MFSAVDRALILLVLAVYPQAPHVSSVFMVLYICNFCYSFTLPVGELSLVGLALDLVDWPLSFSSMTPLFGSSDP